MQKALALTFVIFAIAALVTSVVSIGTTQTVTASSYGKEIIKPNAQCGKTNSCGDSDGDGQDKNWGESVSEAADDDNDGSGDRSGDHGIGDFRADGCKINDRTGDSPVC